jgi:thiamine transport system ATP-binding protein
VLTVEHLEVRYGQRVAVEGVSLSAARGEVLSVLGPSGSGKTSLLRAIAGLETPVAGRVLWDGRDVTGVAPHERRFGLLFQDFALFPHRDVEGNVAFGLRMQRQGRAAIRARVAAVLELVGLGGFGPRALTTLSGGELQRVALARALAPEPELLLLDEPLGSLDRILRERLTAELRVLLHNLGVAAIYVTHDQQEAFALGGRVAVLRAGGIAQIGPPQELWRRPADAFVARFLGFANVVPATSDGARVHAPWGPLPAPAGAPEGAVLLVLPPDATALGAGGVEGTVTDLTFHGDHFVAAVDVGRGTVLHVPVRADATPAVGDGVTVVVDPRLVSVVPA